MDCARRWLDRKPGDIDDGQAPIGGSQYPGAEKGINDGWNLQHIYEGGEQFEKLLDHPSWYGRVARYLGQASPFVFELFINVRNPVIYPNPIATNVLNALPRFSS